MNSDNSFVRDAVAGSISAIISKTIAAPVERVKIILQTQRTNLEIGSPYSGPIECIRRIFYEQGLISFWRGNVANVLRYFPSQSLNFAFKDYFRTIFVPKDNTQFWKMFWGSLAAGGCAGGIGLLGSYPLEVVRTRMAADVSAVSKYTGTLHCLKNIYHESGSGILGILGIYRGSGVAFLGAILYRALYLGGFDIGKDVILGKDNSDRRHSLWWKYGIAQCSTTIVGAICYPIDTVKKRIITMPKKSNGEFLYKGALDCFRSIWTNEGIRAFYAGFSINLVKGFSGALLLVIYDEIKGYLD